MDHKQYEPIFGSWYITDEIGSGGEGVLYRICRTDALGHKYYSALKVISIPAEDSEIDSLMAGGMSLDDVKAYYASVLENTTHEFELLAKLKGNSNIASYEDHDIIGHEDGVGWDILIRLEELTPLVKYSIDEPLSEDDVAQMGRDICRGLSLCNKYGIVHRDIKPDNIFISPSGSYKLGDFGIARIIEQTTAGLSRKGTYEYMAPEIYWGREYGPSVDLYSLGMVMYRYLNDGRMPFMPQSPEPVQAGDREEAFVKRINGHEMPPPRNGSDDLKRIVMKACQYERKDRYRDAAEMLHELEALRAEGGAAEVSTAGMILHAGASGVCSDGDGGASGERREASAKKGRSTKNRTTKIAAAVLLVAAACALCVWLFIPKEVTDIDAGEAEGGTEIYIGDELALECTVSPDRFKNEPVMFTSGDESVFTVDEAGTIHAESVGEATLTMTAKEYTEELPVTVVPKVTSISGVDETIALTTGDTLQLEPVLAPAEFADEPVKYKSSDTAVVTVSEDGLVTAVSAGEATLKVKSGGCTFKSKITVSDPVVYYSSGSSSSKKSSSSSKKSSSSGSGSKGYFDSSDDEHF